MVGAERARSSLAERKGAVVTAAALVQYIDVDLKVSTNLSPLSFIRDGVAAFLDSITTVLKSSHADIHSYLIYVGT